MTIPELTEAKVVHVQPGDVIFLRVASADADDYLVDMVDEFRELWPDNVVFIGLDLDLEVIRADCLADVRGDG